jgi:hypothetical protein
MPTITHASSSYKSQRRDQAEGGERTTEGKKRTKGEIREER